MLLLLIDPISEPPEFLILSIFSFALPLHFGESSFEIETDGLLDEARDS